jgi:hypothetical protein
MCEPSHLAGSHSTHVDRLLSLIFSLFIASAYSFLNPHFLSSVYVLERISSFASMCFLLLASSGGHRRKIVVTLQGVREGGGGDADQKSS